MGLEWDPQGIPGTLMALVGLAFAFVVYLVRPDRLQNRLLALFMFTGGLAELLRVGLRFFAADERLAYAIYITATTFVPVSLAFFLLFLGTLPGRLTAWLRPRPVRIGLVAAAIVCALAFGLRPDLSATGARKGDYLDLWIGDGLGPFFLAVMIAGVVIYLYGAVVAIGATRYAKTGLERRKTRAFAIALVTLCLLTGVYMLIAATLIDRSEGAAIGDRWMEYYIFFAPGVADLLFVSLMTYGILKAQLFDIDVKLKWTVKRGTLAGIFIATFFVVSQLIQNVTTDTLGAVVGAVAAGLLLFAINPLQRFADRLSAAALPTAKDDPDSIRVRKSEVYKAALEGAWQDGKLSPKERTVLTRLQLELGIANQESKALEAQVRKAMGAA